MDTFDAMEINLINKLENDYIIRIKDRWGESIF